MVGTGTYSGDDDAFQTDEVILVQQLQDTRRAAEEYLQAVGFSTSAAFQLAQQLLKPVDADSIPEVCSDLIDKHGGGASPGSTPAQSSDAPTASPLGTARQPPAAHVLAADVAEQVAILIGGHTSLKPQLEAATTSKALAVVMQTHRDFDAAVAAAAKQLEQRYGREGLPPTRSIMAEAYEIIVAGRRVAVDTKKLLVDLKAAKAEAFFAGVILSRIQPADTPSTLLLPSGGRGETTTVRPAPAPGSQLTEKLPARSGGSVVGFGAASSLTDFESDLAHALALSQKEARVSPAGGFSDATVELGFREAPLRGEDYELQAALAVSVSAAGGGVSAPSTEDDQLAAALAASLAPPSSASAGKVTGGNSSDGNEDDQLARALALSMEEQLPEAKYGAAVGELMSMGFDKPSVLQALEASGGSQEDAANILLG